MSSEGLREGYPGALSDDDLAESIDLLIEYLNPHRASANLNPTILLAFLQAGHQEESRRLLERSIQQGEVAIAGARRASRTSVAVAVAALLIAMIGTLSNYWGDRSWQQDQTRILTEIRNLLDP